MEYYAEFDMWRDYFGLLELVNAAKRITTTTQPPIEENANIEYSTSKCEDTEDIIPDVTSKCEDNEDIIPVVPYCPDFGSSSFDIFQGLSETRASSSYDVQDTRNLSYRIRNNPNNPLEIIDFDLTRACDKQYGPESIKLSQQLMIISKSKDPREPVYQLICSFCKSNGERVEYCRTHLVKDIDGNVICPILRRYICPICKATGDKAHTLKYCPNGEGKNLSTGCTFKSKRMACGRFRTSTKSTK